MCLDTNRALEEFHSGDKDYSYISHQIQIFLRGEIKDARINDYNDLEQFKKCQEKTFYTNIIRQDLNRNN